MIKHIVMFTLSATGNEQRAIDIDSIRQTLEALVGPIPGLQSVVFEPDLALVPGHWDAVLISEHDDNAALEAYQVHPMHVEAAGFIGALTVNRATVDFEV